MVLDKKQLKQLYSKESKIVTIHNNIEYTITSHFNKGKPWEAPTFDCIGIEVKEYVAQVDAPF